MPPLNWIIPFCQLQHDYLDRRTTPAIYSAWMRTNFDIDPTAIREIGLRDAEDEEIGKCTIICRMIFLFDRQNNVFNLILIGILISLLASGCNQNSASTQNTVPTQNTPPANVAGSFFPKDEVCRYAENSPLSKFGKLESRWVKLDSPPGWYGCDDDPSKVYVIEDHALSTMPLKDALSTPLKELFVRYSADGDETNDGASSIVIDWTVQNIDQKTEAKARLEYLIPFLDSIVTKALKTPLSGPIKTKLGNSKEFPLTDPKNGSDCEKIGNGYFCFEGLKNDKGPDTRWQNLVITIFPDESNFKRLKDK